MERERSGTRSKAFETAISSAITIRDDRRRPHCRPRRSLFFQPRLQLPTRVKVEKPLPRVLRHKLRTGSREKCVAFFSFSSFFFLLMLRHRKWSNLLRDREMPSFRFFLSCFHQLFNLYRKDSIILFLIFFFIVQL